MRRSARAIHRRYAVRMRIHHLNCISMCPIGGRLMDGRSPALGRGRLVCHCLLVEAVDRLVLIDTGFGLGDVAAPTHRLSRFFLAENAPDLRAEMTATRQVEALGFAVEDVRDIVLTHLDFDHAGGLDDFPHATVHLLAAERAAAETRRTPIARGRYRPEQWGDRRRWRAYQPGIGARWCGFETVRDLDGLPPELLLVPLPGHTLGHAGVAIAVDGGWLLHAGDAYFHHAEVALPPARVPVGVRAYQAMMDADRDARLVNQDRLRRLRRDHGEVRLFCAHDPAEFEALAGRPEDVPAQREPVAVG